MDRTELDVLSTGPLVRTSLQTVREAVSYRRHLLDAHLHWAAPLMRGCIVDLGGKRDRTRGNFVPTPSVGDRWIYVNLDRTTRPDVLADVAAVPLDSSSADCVVCTEVLEHVPDPLQCVREAHRVLRSGGHLICSVPFLYPIHADPHDFQRFTEEGLRRLLSAFPSPHIRKMGGYLGTLGMTLEFGGRRLGRRRLWHRVAARSLFEGGRLLQWFDLSSDGLATTLPFTTGYFAIARKQ